MKEFIVQHPMATLAIILVACVLSVWFILTVNRILQKKVNFSSLKLVFAGSLLTIGAIAVIETGSFLLGSVIILIATALILTLYWQLIKLIDRLSEERQKPFVDVPENNYTIVMKGGDAVKCLANIDGYTVTEMKSGTDKDWQVVKTSPLTLKPGHKEFRPVTFRGKMFVGILPDVKLISVDIDAAHWKSATSIEVTHAKRENQSMIRSQPERRIMLQDLELADGTGVGVHLGVELLLCVEQPGVALLERKGNFYSVIDAGVEFVFANITLGLKAEEFTGIAKTASGTKGLEKLYPQDTTVNALNACGFIIKSGYRVVAFNIKGFQPNEGFKEYIQSMRNVAIAEKEADASKKKIAARKFEITELGGARSDALDKWMRKAKKYNIDPDVAMDAFRSNNNAQLFADPNSNVTFLVQEGGTFGGVPTSPVKKGEKTK